MTTVSIQRALARQITGAMPSLTTVEQRIAVGLYRSLSEGIPVSPAKLAGNLNLSELEVKGMLSERPGIYYDKTGAVIGFWGLSLPPMPHRLQVDGHRLYTWCAWDSLFIPQVIGKEAQVMSTDPLTKERISLAVKAGRIDELKPSSTVMSFLTPKRAFDSDVIQSFCHFVHFFGSPQSGERWTNQHDGTILLSLDQAYELGQLANARNFGSALNEEGGIRREME